MRKKYPKAEEYEEKFFEGNSLEKKITNCTEFSHRKTFLSLSDKFLI